MAGEAMAMDEAVAAGVGEGMQGRREPWALYAIFFLSGWAALIYQVLFSKQLTYVFGSMSTATNTVLATYMGGMALGTWIGGAMAQRVRRPVAVYALCEAAIAIYCAASPFVFHLVQTIYIDMAAGATPDAAGLLPVRVLLGASCLIVPTLLMGMTLPMLAQFFEQRRSALGAAVGRLYAANTLGAGVGALLAGYLILPALGIHKTTLVAVAANLLVAVLALRFQNSAVAAAPVDATGPRVKVASALARRQGWCAIAILGVGGFVTLALEVDYIHLLAVAAGNSTYAFSLMLFAFLIGLGGGAEFGRWMMRKIAPLHLVAWLEFGLCVAIVLSVSEIDRFPDFFASFAPKVLTMGWGEREWIRGLVCCVAMIPPAFFIGAIFPVAIECVGRAFPERPVYMIGVASALNTFGNICGVLVAGFLLLPVIGAYPTVRMLAGVCLALGFLAATVAGEVRRWQTLVASMAAAAGVVMAAPNLDYDRLTTGANVYFYPTPRGHVIDRAESLDGGLTTINATYLRGVGRVLTLLTNGKFQGNDVMEGEVVAQMGFAMAPLLHSDKRDSALVIGYGTGNASRVLHDAGIRHLDVVDISADIFRLANQHLAKVNDRVTSKPGVKAFVTDGRNFLMLSRARYDIISMEISSIWFAGAASLYSRDFYHLAKAHLKPGGVLQQWMQIHHTTPLDVRYTLGSVRAEFRYVWVYLIGGQGIIVASDSAQAVPSAATIAAIDGRPQMRFEVEHYGGTAANLLDDLVLDPDGVDRLLAGQGLPASYYVSDDDNAFLEYSTPKGNAIEGADRTILAMMLRYQNPPPAPAAVKPAASH